MVARNQSMTLPTADPSDSSRLRLVLIHPSNPTRSRAAAANKGLALTGGRAAVPSGRHFHRGPLFGRRPQPCKLSPAIKRNLLPIQSSAKPAGQRTIRPDGHVPLNFRLKLRLLKSSHSEATGLGSVLIIHSAPGVANSAAWQIITDSDVSRFESGCPGSWAGFSRRQSR